jgi:uncharacterized protein (DUF362 family)/Pyruvate/2-oxoacid:ferredoxin oxidoreductase delta subunit
MDNPATVALAKCSSYTVGLEAAVRGLLAPLGGIAAFVKPGQKVLLKPNLLTARTPEQAVTTHPEVVRVLIRLVRERGAIPCVADSPNNVVKLPRVWEKTGFAAMCAEEDVPLLNLERAGSTRFTVNGLTFSVAQPVLDADAVINVPKVKTHVLTTLTGAVKNLYGTIPGFQKTALHKDNPTVEAFGRLLAALYSKVRPVLSVADGIVGMQGDGPSAGQPVALGLLAASGDSVALDSTLCRILRIDPRSVPYFPPLREAGLGETDPVRIRVVGSSVEELTPPVFRVPGTLLSRLIPGRLVRWLGPWIWYRPEFSERCVSCGLCVQACPCTALSLIAGSRPSLNPDRCIGCCCCHEVCPEQAVRMRQSPLITFLRAGKGPS